MSMRERVLSLLRGEAVSRIRFTAVTTAGPITISRATFATVATAIDSGKIKITPRAVFDGNVAAEYSPEAVPGGPSGELLVPLLLGRGEEGREVEYTEAGECAGGCRSRGGHGAIMPAPSAARPVRSAAA